MKNIMATSLALKQYKNKVVKSKKVYNRKKKTKSADSISSKRCYLVSRFYPVG